MNHKIKIYWIKSSSSRSRYLQLALMHLAKQEKIIFKIITKEQALDLNLSTKFLNEIKDAICCFIAEKEERKIKIIIDDSDCFTQISPLIIDADIYFCGPFNSNFHLNKEFINPYNWQKEYDLTNYKKDSQKKIKLYGQYFNKVMKYIPMPINFKIPTKTIFLEKIFSIFHHKIKDNLSWENLFKLFNNRYNKILEYRNNSIKYDIVLLDTLWAWPTHRIKLHQRLKAISNRYKILHHIKSSKKSLKWWIPIVEKEFNIKNAEKFIKNISSSFKIHNSYEKMITSSRLCVFATGKHWGWRQIMFVALCCGLPILMDKPIYEPYFKFEEFKIFYNDNEWAEIESLLYKIDENEWKEIKKHNIRVFEKYLSPSAVGDYIIKRIEEKFYET